MNTKDKDPAHKPTDENSTKPVESRPSRMRSAAPDDPIYTRGFVIGMIGRNRLPEEDQS
jgi:hypothetical protein